MYIIKIVDGSTNSLLNINVKCTIYKVEQTKNILLNVLTFRLWASTKTTDKHKLQRTTALILLRIGISICSVDMFHTAACYRNLSVILGFPVDNRFQKLVLNITLEHFPDFMNCNTCMWNPRHTTKCCIPSIQFLFHKAIQLIQDY